jgi:poly-gamma-glutamate synthesis protein (capsule biosynthesis protein)
MTKRFRLRAAAAIVALLLVAVAIVATRRHERRPETKPPPTPVAEEICVVLVGDIMLSRAVAARMRRAGDWDLPFRDTAAYLRAADLSFGNLESPFSGSEKPPAKGSLVFNAPPQSVLGLEHVGFRVVSLANNHALDQGLRGLIYTRKHLREHHIQAVGAGETLDEAWQPAVLEIKNTRIGFIAASYASINDAGKSTNPYVARTGDLNRLKAAIAALRSQQAFIVVSMHAGAEYSPKPHPSQVAFARAAIDVGAHVVVGHHPHWTQPVERYNGGLIFYSLGNFIFDQRHSARTPEGLVVRLRIRGRRLLSAELQPTTIQHFCCPQLAAGRPPEVVRP